MVEKKIESIEGRLSRLEESQEEYSEQMQDVMEEMRGLNKKIDKDLSDLMRNDLKSQTLLRELRSQNVQIVSMVLENTQKAEEREYDFKVLKWTDVMKIVGALIGAGGILHIIAEALTS